MPSLSALKRTGRGTTPWQPNADGTLSSPGTSNTTTVDDGDTDTNDNDSNSSSTPSNRDRREFSKRELLHGLISRSIRGAGRALLPTSQPESSAAATQLQPRSIPGSASHSQSRPHSLSRSPSPSFFRSKKSRDASPRPHRLFHRSRQASASTSAPAKKYDQAVCFFFLISSYFPHFSFFLLFPCQIYTALIFHCRRILACPLPHLATGLLGRISRSFRLPPT